MKLVSALFVLLFLMIVVSCRKDKLRYHQVYDVTYLQHQDSFLALAFFYSNKQTGARVLLSENDAVYFNNKPPEKIIEHVYLWKGEGKTDVRFTLAKRKNQLTTFETASRLGKFELEYPDTISKAKGYTIKINGTTGHLPHIYIIDAVNQQIADAPVEGDVIYVSPASLKNWSDGPMTIRLQETIRGEVMRDGDMSGTFNYHLVYDKPAYYTK